MNEFNLYPFLRTNELSGSITKYALEVDQYMNVGLYEKMLEAFETGLFDRGFRFCHKNVDEDQYKVHLKSAMKIELGEIVMTVRWQYMSPDQSLSEIRERIFNRRDDGDALVWVDGFIAALDQKGLYLAHSDQMPPFVQPSVELPEAAHQVQSSKSGVVWSRWTWGAVAVVSMLLGGLAAAAPTIIDKFKRHDLTVGDWRTDSYPTLEALPKIEVATHRAIQYPDSMRYWCSGDEVFCTAVSTGNLNETLRGMISAIPKSEAKHFNVRLAVVPVEDYEDSN